jgi:hypothetical protein
MSLDDGGGDEVALPLEWSDKDDGALGAILTAR